MVPLCYYCTHNLFDYFRFYASLPDLFPDCTCLVRFFIDMFYTPFFDAYVPRCYCKVLTSFSFFIPNEMFIYT